MAYIFIILISSCTSVQCHHFLNKYDDYSHFLNHSTQLYLICCPEKRPFGLISALNHPCSWTLFWSWTAPAKIHLCFKKAVGLNKNEYADQRVYIASHRLISGRFVFFHWLGVEFKLTNRGRGLTSPLASRRPLMKLGCRGLNHKPSWKRESSCSRCPCSYPRHAGGHIMSETWDDSQHGEWN